MSFIDEQVARLRAKGTEFSNAFAQFQANKARAARNPATKKEWERLNGYALAIQKYVTLSNGTVDGIVKWLSSTFGARQINGLALLPAIPAAAWAYVSAAVAALGYFINSAYELNKRLNFEQVQGRAPGTPPTLAQSMSNTALYIALAAVAVFVLPKLLDKRKGK